MRWTSQDRQVTSELVVIGARYFWRCRLRLTLCDRTLTSSAVRIPASCLHRFTCGWQQRPYVT